MTPRLRSILVVLLAVWAVGLGCGPARSPYGTSLRIAVRYGASPAVVQLRFAGLEGAEDAFPSTTRPEVPGSAPLASPQSVRVLLPDSRAGAPVRVRVEGLGANGGAVVGGEALSPTLIAGDEVSVSVSLDVAGLDAGSWPTGTGGGGGGGDGGTGGDAGTWSGGCNCATTCCGATDTCAQPLPLQVTSTRAMSVVGCGVEGLTCTFACDPNTTSQCFGRQCLCGNARCNTGQRCVATATGFDCVCDRESNCHGCCSGAACVQNQSGTGTCGTAGDQCRSCPAGKVCGADGVCLGTTCDAGMCRSAEGCTAPAFPTCLNGANCMPCDPLRSDRCGPSGTCRCGAGSGCVSSSYCDQTTANPTCKLLMQ